MKYMLKAARKDHLGRRTAEHFLDKHLCWRSYLWSSDSTAFRTSSLEEAEERRKARQETINHGYIVYIVPVREEADAWPRT